ncbi:hypothetical protein [Streptomyces sp. NPDC020489]|uniref:hypothetical protein n=1 Tax=Streptomyces sp. NPDC020489 TaxID=3365077 RepID=UPI00379B88DA
MRGVRTAPGARGAFRTLYRKHTADADAATAEKRRDALIAEGRCVEDVHAAG